MFYFFGVRMELSKNMQQNRKIATQANFQAKIEAISTLKHNAAILHASKPQIIGGLKIEKSYFSVLWNSEGIGKNE